MFRWLANAVRGVRESVILITHGHLGSWLFAGPTRLVAAGVPITITGGAGTALSAPVITKTSGTSYPFTFDFTRPLDWDEASGVKVVTQWCADGLFAGGVSETTTTITGSTTSFDLINPDIAAGTDIVRMGGYTGARPTVLNWSNYIGVGDTVAATITSSNAASGYQFVATSGTATASKGGYWSITGGANSDLFTINTSTGAWTMVSQSATGAFVVQLTFTTYCGVTTNQTLTVTLATNTPSAFSFTDVTNATLSTQYTSNTITIAGLVGGASVPVTITGGTYSKNGGAYTSAAGTCVNGDTFAVRCTSSSSNNDTTNVVLTAGATSDTYSVATPVVLSTTTTWNPSDKNANILLSNGNMTAAGTINGANGMVRSTPGKSTGKRYAEVYPAMASGGFGKVGVSDGTESLSNTLGDSSHSSGYQSDGGLSNCVESTTTIYSDTNAHTIGLAIDCDAGTVVYYLDGVFVAHGPYGGNPNLSVPLYIAMSANWTSTAATINTGHSAWVYGPPSGYVPWDV